MCCMGGHGINIDGEFIFIKVNLYPYTTCQTTSKRLICITWTRLGNGPGLNAVFSWCLPHYNGFSEMESPVRLSENPQKPNINKGNKIYKFTKYRNNHDQKQESHQNYNMSLRQGSICVCFQATRRRGCFEIKQTVFFIYCIESQVKFF